MRTLNVELGTRSYPIYIGPALLSSAEIFSSHITGHQVMVVTNDTIARLYLDDLTRALSGYDVHTKVLPDGEQYKNMDTLTSIFDALLEVPCDRQSTVIALGGGVVGDIAGFAAACYQRGVTLIQVPTTLLAQVDSSVGGKTAVNHAMGKNMIGAFYQPKAVIADTNTLDTLPDRELRAGVAEVIKYGLIGDHEFFHWLEENIDALLKRSQDTLAFAIERSCMNKSQIVARDELEKGERALLNLGHTFAHAIETATHYGSWLHGEAVAVGMLMAADVSVRLNNISALEFDRIAALVDKAELPVRPPREISPSQFIDFMSVDKKVEQGNIRLVLLQAIGRAYLSDNYPASILDETLHCFSAQ